MEHPAQPAMDAGITTAPAIVGNDRLDFLAANQLGRAMYSDLLLDPSAAPNFARHIFLDSSARRFYPNWDQARPRRRQPANGGRERPPRQPPTRTRRRAVHPKRR